MSRRKKHPATSLCAYCGSKPTSTRDHILPRCLFLSPTPGDIPKVLTCSDCNNQVKSQNDEYLREVLVTDIAVSGSLIAEALLTGPVLRAVRRNQSRIGRAANTKGRLETVVTPQGLYLGSRGVVPLEGERIISAMSMIVRGLHYDRTQLRIPKDYMFDVSRLYPDNPDQLSAEMAAAGFNGPYCWGNMTVCCWFGYNPLDVHEAGWLFCFYRRIFISVIVKNPTGTWGLENGEINPATQPNPSASNISDIGLVGDASP